MSASLDSPASWRIGAGTPAALSPMSNRSGGRSVDSLDEGMLHGPGRAAHVQSIAKKSKEQLAEDVFALQAQVHALTDRNKLLVVDKRKLQAQLAHAEMLMGGQRPGSPLYNAPAPFARDSDLVRNLKDVNKLVKKERDEALAELAKLQRHSRVTRVHELEAEVRMLNDEVHRQMALNTVMNQRMRLAQEQVKEVLQQAQAHRQRSRYDQQADNTPVGVSPHEPGKRQLRTVVDNLNNAHRCIMTELRQLQNSLPPGLTWTQLADRVAKGQYCGAKQVIQFLQSHKQRVACELDRLPGSSAPAADLPGQPAVEVKKKARAPSAPLKTPNGRAARSPGSLVATPEDIELSDLMRLLNHPLAVVVFKMRAMEVATFAESEAAQKESAALGNLMSLFILRHQELDPSVGQPKRASETSPSSHGAAEACRQLHADTPAHAHHVAAPHDVPRPEATGPAKRSDILHASVADADPDHADMRSSNAARHPSHGALQSNERARTVDARVSEEASGVSSEQGHVGSSIHAAGPKTAGLLGRLSGSSSTEAAAAEDGADSQKEGDKGHAISPFSRGSEDRDDAASDDAADCATTEARDSDTDTSKGGNDNDDDEEEEEEDEEEAVEAESEAESEDGADEGDSVDGHDEADTDSDAQASVEDDDGRGCSSGGQPTDGEPADSELDDDHQASDHEDGSGDSCDSPLTDGAAPQPDSDQDGSYHGSGDLEQIGSEPHGGDENPSDDGQQPGAEEDDDVKGSDGGEQSGSEQHSGDPALSDDGLQPDSAEDDGHSDEGSGDPQTDADQRLRSGRDDGVEDGLDADVGVAGSETCAEESNAANACEEGGDDAIDGEQSFEEEEGGKTVAGVADEPQLDACDASAAVDASSGAAGSQDAPQDAAGSVDNDDQGGDASGEELGVLAGDAVPEDPGHTHSGDEESAPDDFSVQGELRAGELHDQDADLFGVDGAEGEVDEDGSEGGAVLTPGGDALSAEGGSEAAPDGDEAREDHDAELSDVEELDDSPESEPADDIGELAEPEAVDGPSAVDEAAGNGEVDSAADASSQPEHGLEGQDEPGLDEPDAPESEEHEEAVAAENDVAEQGEGEGGPDVEEAEGELAAEEADGAAGATDADAEEI